MRHTAIRARLYGLGFLVAAACTGVKGRAQADISAAERSIAALPADAAKLVPEQIAPLTDALNRGKDLLAKGDYAGASALVRDVPLKAKQIADWVPTQKAQLVALMDTLAVAMPRNLDAIRGRLDTIAKSKRLPRGLDKQEYQEAKDTYAAATAEWDAVTKSFKAGEIASAMTRALSVKSRVSHSLMALGLVSDERAWSNVTLPNP